MVMSARSRRLSRREDEILDAICTGLSYREIAKRLSITLRTVKFHAQSIRRKRGTPRYENLRKSETRSRL
jgi:DNA-binding CsgD family transcriptional regulator